MTNPTTPHDGMSMAAFTAARDALFAAARAFDVPVNCHHCQHFDMGDCKKHGAPVPKAFQEQRESCDLWQFDGIPF